MLHAAIRLFLRSEDPQVQLHFVREGGAPREDGESMLRNRISMVGATGIEPATPYDVNGTIPR